MNSENNDIDLAKILTGYHFEDDVTNLQVLQYIAAVNPIGNLNEISLNLTTLTEKDCIIEKVDIIKYIKKIANKHVDWVLTDNMQLMVIITKAANAIVRKTRRGVGNIIICSSNIYKQLNECLEAFNTKHSLYKIYESKHLDNEIIVAFKGNPHVKNGKFSEIDVGIITNEVNGKLEIYKNNNASDYYQYLKFLDKEILTTK